MVAYQSWRTCVRGARALGRRFDTAFRPLRLTSGQLSLLMALSRPEPTPLGAVAAVLAMDRTTLTAALKPLERRGRAGWRWCRGPRAHQRFVNRLACILDGGRRDLLLRSGNRRPGGLRSNVQEDVTGERISASCN